MTPIREFNELPFDCVWQIFQRIGLQDLLNSRAVCQYWRSVIEQKIFATRRSLKLFPSFEDVVHYVVFLKNFGFDAEPRLCLRNYGLEDDLIINLTRIDHSFVSQLARLFPRIDSLVLYTEFDSAYDELGNLIKMWSCTLRHISIFDNVLSQGNSTPLYEALLSAVHLTRLDIFSGSSYEHPFDHRLAPIISQLQALTLYGYRYDYFEPIFVALRDCTELRLDALFFSDEDFRQIFKKNRAITQQITKFWFHCLDPTAINVICDNLRNVRHLHWSIDFVLDAATLRELAKLSHLDSLHLSDVQSVNLDDLAAAYAARKLPVLGSVKTVHLFPFEPFKQSTDDTSGGDDDRFCHFIGFIFPAIEWLHLRTKRRVIRQPVKRLRLPDCAVAIRRMDSTDSYARQLGRHRARYLREEAAAEESDRIAENEFESDQLEFESNERVTGDIFAN